MMDVNLLLIKNPNLKEFFDKKVNNRFENIIKSDAKERNKDVFYASNLPIEEDESEKDNKPNKIKRLYRDIVKVTHPDKINDLSLNEIYIKSTNMYEANDIAGMYSICSNLKIDYEFDDDDLDRVNNKLELLKSKISFVESTFTWRWHYSKTQEEKDKLVLLFIKMQLQ